MTKSLNSVIVAYNGTADLSNETIRSSTFSAFNSGAEITRREEKFAVLDILALLNIPIFPDIPAPTSFPRASFLFPAKKSYIFKIISCTVAFIVSVASKK